MKLKFENNIIIDKLSQIIQPESHNTNQTESHNIQVESNIQEQIIQESSNIQEQTIQESKKKVFDIDENFNTFLDNTIEYTDKHTCLKLFELVFLYKDDYKFSRYIKNIMEPYKQQFEKYIKTKYPNIRNYQHPININGKTNKGYQFLIIKPQFIDKIKELVKQNEKFVKEQKSLKIKEHDEKEFIKDEKLWDFFKNNIEYTSDKLPLRIIDIAEKYENRIIEKKTNVCMNIDYKYQFEKYIKETYPGVVYLQSSIRLDKDKKKGWYYFKIK